MKTPQYFSLLFSFNMPNLEPTIHSEGEECGHTEAEHFESGCNRVSYYESNAHLIPKKSTPTEAPTLHKTCTGSNCPERFSVCCGVNSVPVFADEGRHCYLYSLCSKCGKKFRGGKCTAGDNLPVPTEAPRACNCFQFTTNGVCEHMRGILAGEPQKDWREKFGSAFDWIEKEKERCEIMHGFNSDKLKSFISRIESEALQRGREEAIKEALKGKVKVNNFGEYVHAEDLEVLLKKLKSN